MIDVLLDTYSNLCGRRDAAQVRLNMADEKIKLLNRQQRNIEQAQTIIQTVAKQTQEQLSEQISSIVTLALNSIFDEEYEFTVLYEAKRGKTEATLSFKKEGLSINPLDDSGGGVVDIASFALRIALWNLSRPRPSNTLILDEPMRFLDRTLQPKASELLQTLSKKLGIQFIIVSHDEGIIKSADKIFEVSNEKGISNVTQKECIENE